MELKKLKPRIALNKAFLKVKPNRPEIEIFKKNLIGILDTIDEFESEEFHKNLVSDFLKNTWYAGNQFINTKGRNDLVIHNGATANSTVGVIIEAKKPANKAEMLRPDNINVKAFQELVFYYLQERIINKNTEIKHLVATNIYEWYIFDGQLFEKLFAQNKPLVKKFIDFKEGRSGGNKTEFFYNEIAATAIAALPHEITFTYFDIREYDKPLRNNDKKDDNVLIALYKLLSPEHLLKLPFANDSNSLDKVFYTELLHIIGLTETKEGGKKLIQRKEKGQRNAASLMESAIVQLDNLDKLSRIDKPSQYGDTTEERLFNVALELSITWINRILFLKLLEAQLIKYHKGDKTYAFLNTDKVKGFDDLNTLFFQVLAKIPAERSDEIRQLFAHVPYLNSSLFEPTDIEHAGVFISQLNDGKLPLLSNSVIKDTSGKKRTGEMTTVEYLFEFLNAYDFSSEGSEEIQEDNKRLINASVLGLIFEKINGYKDGSFFTPGFITMYMCRETIRRAIVQKFNETKGWNCADLNELYDKIEDKKEANSIINSLKLCDPAVGSGHFLVSALNEIIAIKSELKILLDREGKTLRDYHVEVENDELVVTDDDGGLFSYNPTNKESQRVQETMFHEKQTIIENCLFGVDLNPNSVKICRLRLWIELLKNAYYRIPDVETHGRASLPELETLPNIDINIKCGNSLISRYALDADIKKALKRSKWTIDSYRLAVMTYRNAQSKDEKRAMERLIKEIKSDFESEIAQNDKRLLSLNSLRGELYQLSNQTTLFEQTKTEKAKFNKAVEEKAYKIQKLEKELDEIRTNKIYENAFEWRFEFPEVLNDEGDFMGFDVVIGNPPYISLSTNEDLKIISDRYKTYVQTGDIYALFYELGLSILKTQGTQSLIISNKWMRANYGLTLRKYILENSNPLILIDFGQNLIFENAVVHTNIIISQKNLNNNRLSAIRFDNDNFFNNVNSFGQFVAANKIENLQLDENPWNVIENNVSDLKLKIESGYKRLKDWNILFCRGILTGLNEAFIIDGKKRKEIIENDSDSEKFIKPILRGRDTRAYYSDFKDFWILNIPKGYTIKTKSGRIDVVFEPMPRYGNFNDADAWDWFIEKHPTVSNHLLPFKQKAEKRDDQGDFWWELRACSYIAEFEKPKIIFSEIVSEPQFYYDEEAYYPEATVFFITGEKLKYLTAMLNSKAVTFFFKSFYMGGELVGKIRYKKAFLEQIPIPEPRDLEENKIIKLVNEIIKFKVERKSTTALESEIDQLVYQLYGLTEEEIKIVEGEKKI
jgi:type II restriction/modification system DNA methylase subunit YeeA